MNLTASFLYYTNSTFQKIIVVVLLIASAIEIQGNPWAQMTEICDNAIDDDGDGLIDLNDNDCECLEIEVISRIPNPSFEETNCCPGTRSELYCADGWIQASEPTTDLIHNCGSWDGWPDFPPPRPFPDGDGIVGFRDGRRIGNNDQELEWKEYAGACLTAPLLKGETYRFEFYVGFVNSTVSPRINITFFGTSSCEFLPFGKGNQELGCPTNGPNWRWLSSVEVNGSSGWVQSSLQVKPVEDIYAIAIGPPCSATSASVSTYYFFDDLVLDDIENFELIISEETHPCSDNFILSVPERDGFEYQWYKDGIAMVGENTSTLDNVVEGNYQLRLIKDGSCRITSVYNHKIPVLEDDDYVKICDGSQYNFGNKNISVSGDYTETFTSVDGCDSIVYLTVEGLTTIRDTVYARVFPGDKYTFGEFSTSKVGETIVPLTDDEGCDYFVHIFLENFEVYAPNVFSPNGDGNNDYFQIIGGPELLEIKKLTVFDRWGGSVFSSSGMIPGNGGGWDGKTSSGIAIGGVYVYSATVLMDNGLEKTYYGSVLLVR